MTGPFEIKESDQRPQIQETKLVLKQKQTNKKTHYIKITIYLVFAAKVCYINRGSKGCLSPETKTRIHLGTRQKG